MYQVQIQEGRGLSPLIPSFKPPLHSKNTIVLKERPNHQNYLSYKIYKHLFLIDLSRVNSEFMHWDENCVDHIVTNNPQTASQTNFL